MNKLFVAIFAFCSITVRAQIDNSISILLNDKSYVYTDSAILYITDTNNVNKFLQPHGVWRNRNLNNPSQLEEVSMFWNGKLHGHSIVFYPNGQIASSSYNLLGIPHGPEILYWKNGNPMTIRNFQNGLVIGTIKEFDSLGQIRKISQVKQGVKNGIEIEIYPSGNVYAITQFVDDKENGFRKEFSDTKKSDILREYYIKNGIKLFGRFYQKGILTREEKY